QGAEGGGGRIDDSGASAAPRGVAQHVVVEYAAAEIDDPHQQQQDGRQDARELDEPLGRSFRRDPLPQCDIDRCGHFVIIIVADALSVRESVPTAPKITACINGVIGANDVCAVTVTESATATDGQLLGETKMPLTLPFTSPVTRAERLEVVSLSAQ